MGIRERQKIMMEKGASNITKWVGSTTSVAMHTALFVLSFILPFTGYVSFERMLLVLTTIVSLEAIYLSIFIQMSLNMNNQNIEIIQGDIEEIGEDIEEIQKDVDEIQEGVDEIGEDIEEIQKDVDEIQEGVDEISEDIEEIQKDVDEIQEDVVEIQEETKEEMNNEKQEKDILLSIQSTLVHLQKEIEKLKTSQR